jgi:hypothetical protein
VDEGWVRRVTIGKEGSVAVAVAVADMKDRV